MPLTHTAQPKKAAGDQRVREQQPGDLVPGAVVPGCAHPIQGVLILTPAEGDPGQALAGGQVGGQRQGLIEVGLGRTQVGGLADVVQGGVVKALGVVLGQLEAGLLDTAPRLA
jgi:hypothetical protein